jgi:ADP-ribosylglycohydrolase
MSLVQLAPLILKRAAASRSSGEWSDDDYDVLADGVVVGRIMKAAAKPADASWLWTYGQHEDRTPTHGYEATREAAMAAFAKSWRREGT